MIRIRKIHWTEYNGQRRDSVAPYLGTLSVTTNSEPSSVNTFNCHNVHLTIGERANGSRWDSSVDTPEAPRFVEALLTLQSCLNGVQGEEGQIHTHPCTASCLDKQRSFCEASATSGSNVEDSSVSETQQ